MPGAVLFDAEEVERITVMRLAMQLHKLPSEIRAMPLQDAADLLEVMQADQD